MTSQSPSQNAANTRKPSMAPSMSPACSIISWISAWSFCRACATFAAHCSSCREASRSKRSSESGKCQHIRNWVRNRNNVFAQLQVIPTLRHSHLYKYILLDNSRRCIYIYEYVHAVSALTQPRPVLLLHAFAFAH